MARCSDDMTKYTGIYKDAITLNKTLRKMYACFTALIQKRNKNAVITSKTLLIIKDLTRRYYKGDESSIRCTVITTRAKIIKLNITPTVPTDSIY